MGGVRPDDGATRPGATRPIGVEVIAVSLARYVERHGDPIDRVYARLFAAHPETEPLFLLDRNGAARGSMLANVVAVLLDLDGDRDFAPNMIAAEMLNHVDLGVAPETFMRFFDLLRDVVREGLGDEWRGEIADAWASVIDDAKAAATAGAT